MSQQRKEIQTLNQTEETVMQAVWMLKKGFIGDIIQCLPEPKMPYNTVVTTVRNLEKKGFIKHETFANANRYSPIVNKKTYIGQTLNNLVQKHFSSSYSSLLSFFVEDDIIDREELEQALKLIEKHNNKNKGE